MEIWDWIIVALWLGVLLVFIRHEVVFNVRVDILRDPALGSAAYEALPSYREMAWRPGHLMRWTTPQWVKWLRAEATADV